MNTTMAPIALPVQTASMVRTTLYDLIVAIQEVVPEEADTLVVATVLALLRSGRLHEADDGDMCCTPDR